MTRLWIVFSLVVAAACSGGNGGPSTAFPCNVHDEWCVCAETNIEPDEACRADLWTNGYCCASETVCQCLEAACQWDSATRCRCAPTISFDTETFGTECFPPEGGRCCLGPGTGLGTACICSNDACDPDATEVASCLAADVMDCGTVAERTESCN